ncbi:hypothetical protein [uncultured Methanobrevibacter sp.]|uniref:hypothetical protein n=1 Tax=uncultured Methanobrevibacter sp. TaxID=253161 RepID=UPI002638924D|nr:hypothetical protein [uncultured Methanobrevibacter sp.]
MVTIKHILKDGTQIDDIAGKVIKADQFPVLYEAINRINKAGDANETISTSD